MNPVKAMANVNNMFTPLEDGGKISMAQYKLMFLGIVRPCIRPCLRAPAHALARTHLRARTPATALLVPSAALPAAACPRVRPPSPRAVARDLAVPCVDAV